MGQSAPTANRVQAHSFLTLHYCIALEDGTKVIDTFGGPPATLQLGAGQLVDTLESCLIGLEEGAQCSFEIGCGADVAAFGPRNPTLVQKIARSALPADVELVANNLVEFSAPGGQTYSGMLKELDEKFALFDFNHPFAERAIRFDVSIIGVL